MLNLPTGWTGFVGGIATNLDPIKGGIIDKVMLSNPEEWFVIPNDDRIAAIDGLASQDEAFAALSNAVEALLPENDQLTYFPDIKL